MAFAILATFALEEPPFPILLMELQVMFVQLEATAISALISQLLVLLEHSTQIQVLSLKLIVKLAHLATIVQGLIQGCLLMDFLMRQASACQAIIVMEELLHPINTLLRKDITL